MSRFQPENTGGGENAGPRPNRLTPKEPRCKVCNSPYRRDIDKYLVMGMSYSEICRIMEYHGENFSRQGLSRHSRKHLELKASAVRAVIEQDAKDALLDVEDAKQFLMTRRGILKIMLQEGYESILKGEVVVEPTVLLQVASTLERMEAEEQSVAIDEMMADFRAFSEAVKLYVPEDMWQLIYDTYLENLEMSKQTPKIENLVQIESPELELLEGEIDEPENDDSKDADDE